MIKRVVANDQACYSTAYLWYPETYSAFAKPHQSILVMQFTFSRLSECGCLRSNLVVGAVKCPDARLSERGTAKQIEHLENGSGKK